jgi:PAS domain S-box-containing protein
VKLAPKLTLLFALLAVVPILIVGYLAYENGRRSIEQETISHLIAVNDIKGDEIETWLDHNRQSIEELAQRPLLREYAAVLATHDESDPAYAKAHDSLIEEHLKLRLAYGDFSELFLLCPHDGLTVVSTDQHQEGKYRDDQPYFTEGKTSTYIQNIYYSQTLQQPAMTIGTPVKDREGKLVGVLAGRLNLNELSNIMVQGRDLRHTEDSYLVDKSNFFITEPRFDQGYALKKAVRTEGVEAGLSGKDGVGFYKDYRGMLVVGAYKWLPERQLAIITEIDQAEAFAPIHRLAWIVGAIMLAAILAVVVLGVFFARTITRPILQLVQGAEEIGHGNLAVKVSTNARDEIGDLSRAFDNMTAQLQETMVSRDELAKEVVERKRVEEELRESEEKYRDLVENLPDVVFAVDQNGALTYVSPAVEPMTGYSVSELTGRTFADFLHPDDLARAFENFVRTLSGEALVDELRFFTKSGETRWLRNSNKPIFLEDRIVGVRGVFSDITELKQAEEALRKTVEELQRSNAELERFAYVASHDLQEPLRTVASYTQLLEKRYKDKLDTDATEFIDFAVNGARRMQQLINDLLAYSRVGTRGKPFEPTDMEAVLEAALANLQVAVNDSKAKVTHDPLPTVMGDDGQLVQVFQNLIHNAIKFRGKKPPLVHISAGRKGDEYLFSVKDNGIGIDPQYFERVFIIFQRLHRDDYLGTGIGLAISNRIVQRHGGKMWLESKPAKGSTFYFTIPAKGTSQQSTVSSQKETSDYRLPTSD